MPRATGGLSIQRRTTSNNAVRDARQGRHVRGASAETSGRDLLTVEPLARVPGEDVVEPGADLVRLVVREVRAIVVVVASAMARVAVKSWLEDIFRARQRREPHQEAENRHVTAGLVHGTSARSFWVHDFLVPGSGRRGLPLRRRSARRASLSMWRGPVPQQPPTRVAPASNQVRARVSYFEAAASGAASQPRPSPGSPAFA